MTIDEMNKYILHYLKADKTHSAIMLTGAWGSGKSYYIQNNLCPFLAQKENGEIQSIIVSLYGMTRLSDISKSLYMETRLKCLNANTESAALARIAARTIIKGITNHVGIDVIATDADLSRLYESADLSNKLIILEDIERTQINTIEVLGYVNSLVEQDGVKVLLVANEDELIKFEPIIGETPPKYDWNKTNTFDVKRNKNYTNTTKLYLSVKEKTICDTINFVGDIKSAIKQIIKTFDSTLKQFADDDVVEEIYSILSKDSSFNLRSLIFACQKSSDIFQMTGLIADAGDDFSKTLFEGVLCFSLKFKQGINMPWTGSRLLSFDLGNSRYPLFRFCYDYICMQQLNTDLLLETKEELEKLRQYDRYKSINDSDLQMLYNYQIQPESAICQAVENITKKLKNQYNMFFTYIDFSLPDEECVSPEGERLKRKHSCRMFYTQIGDIAGAKHLSPKRNNSCLIKKESIFECWDSIVNLWFSEHKKIAEVTDSYIGDLYLPAYIQTAFLNIARGLEAYHRLYVTKLDDTTTVDLSKERVIAFVNSNIPTVDRERILSRINYETEESFGKRIKQLITSMPTGLKNTIFGELTNAEQKRLITQTVQTRNYYTHRDNKEKYPLLIEPPLEIAKLSDKLAIVLNYFCLTQIGVPADIVENALTAKCEMEI